MAFFCWIVSDLYMPPGTHWNLMNRTLDGIYRGVRSGEIPPRPMWSRALQVLALGLLVFGFWRDWSGR